ncbi:MAG: class II aldolase/adducin family protein [Syntrophales bacterium]|nr:class II aldolase/adducin family protein [Syntrophales bacterium]
MTSYAVEKYAEKIHKKGLFEKDSLIIGIEESDSVQILGKGNNEKKIVETLIKKLKKKAIIWAHPIEPFKCIIDYLVYTSNGKAIKPEDYESVVLIKEILICNTPEVETLLEALAKGRVVIVRNGSVIITTRNNLDFAYTLLCALCFSCSVKFFTDIVSKGIQEQNGEKVKNNLESLLWSHRREINQEVKLMNGPFYHEEKIKAAMAEAGLYMVTTGLVDANFGNISYRLGNTLYISKRGAPLSELTGQITQVPLEWETQPPEASTEYPTHRGIMINTTHKAVCHAHPLFAVVMSLNCPEKSLCAYRENCHIKCPQHRSLGDIPVVSGNTGGGPLGLNQSVPPAVARAGAAIALGHGVFTAGRIDFNEAIIKLQNVENVCLEAYISLLRKKGIDISVGI